MDPDFALRILSEALRDEDWTQVVYSAEDLAEWLERGGFWPEKANIVELLRALADMAENLEGEE